MNMKWILRMGVLAVSALAFMAVSSSAGAAPGGTSIQFHYGDGQFCWDKSCAHAHADFSGLVYDGDGPTTLSNLSGTLTIGPSPYGNTTRHLTVKAPGVVMGNQYGDFEGYEDCVQGLTEPGIEYFIQSQQWTFVSLNAGPLKGTGEVEWWHEEVCEVIEVNDEFVPVINVYDWSFLRAELVGSKTAGTLNLFGPGPCYGCE